MESVTVGVDIGSSAIRAVEVDCSAKPPRLRHFAQVGLPAGAVRDGEVADPEAVAEALRRLWSEGGFSTNKVVLGISGPRVFVRQADMPAMEEADLRSALRFEGQELIPIPAEDATFDFAVLSEAPRAAKASRSSAGGEEATVAVLLAAAHKEVLAGHLRAASAAGLEVKALDPTPLALMRAVPPFPSDGGGSGLEVIVSVGADLSIVGVRQGETPRFIRTLTMGGAKLTDAIASSMSVEPAVAERVKRQEIPAATPVGLAARKAIATELRDLAEDVRATVDFFASQVGEVTLERLVVTGGSQAVTGLVEALAGGSPTPVARADSFALLDVEVADLTKEELARVSAVAAAAVGHALWPVGPRAIRLSLVPEEVHAKAKERQAKKLALGAVAAVVVVLAGLGLVAHQRVADEQARARHAKAQAATLAAEVATLQAKTVVHAQMLARAHLVVTALNGDVDWVRVLGQLAATMPPNLYLTDLAANLNPPGAPQSASTPGVGTLTFTVKGTGGLPAVSAWLNGLAADPDLSGTFVTGITVDAAGNQVSFSSNATLTPTSHSTRGAQIKDEYLH